MARHHMPAPARAYTHLMPEKQAIQFDQDGLVACVAQDWDSGEVLTVAYMSAESLALTCETREVHFWSRSREEIWRKGETSGNVLELKQLRYDCDADAIVALVRPTGPACHTGERSCFHRELEAGGRPHPPASPRSSSASSTTARRRFPHSSSCAPPSTDRRTCSSRPSRGGSGATRSSASGRTAP